MGTVCQGCKTFGGGGGYASWAPLKRWEEKFTENTLNTTGDGMEAILRKGTGMNSVAGNARVLGYSAMGSGPAASWPGTCVLTSTRRERGRKLDV